MHLLGVSLEVHVHLPTRPVPLSPLQTHPQNLELSFPYREAKSLKEPSEESECETSIYPWIFPFTHTEAECNFILAACC